MNVCPLCHKRVSEWMMASDKTVIIADQVVHKSCVMDHDITIAEVERRIHAEGG